MSLYTKTLVRNHLFNSDKKNDDKQKKTIYQLITENENLITFIDKNDDNNNNTESVSISFFGKLYNSTGRLFCPSVDYLRKDIHEFIGNVLLECHYLSGSMVIQRNILQTQHFILDFDLKKTPLLKPQNKMNLQDFNFYKQKRNKTFTLEQNFIYDNDDKRIKKLNINYIIYEILLLLRNLGIEDDIYIMGKRGGCFENGFHIEIPSFLMNYHDLVLFYEIIHSFVKNEDFLDATRNYSAFGSTKSDGDSVYLPYCCFSRENKLICEEIMFENLKEAFDFFNIFKPLAKEQENIHYFDIIFKREISSSKEKVTAMIKENEDLLK